MEEHFEDCCAIVEHMHLFFDGELTEVQAHAIRVHLSGCEDCDDMYKVEELMRKAIQRCLVHQSAPESLRSRIASLHVCVDHTIIHRHSEPTQ